MEILELLDHPYFVASQYHPEFKSRPLKPSPLFVGLMLACTGKLNEWLEKKKNHLKNSMEVANGLRQSQDSVARVLEFN